ncbi:alpha/beta hydrolase [Pseudonocardia halophobica]|uniref:alpha/beta hydrolase n=1 Tax=Pseudonocardia halophobica TaxID=29401 RepID=UPI003D94C489
MTGQPAPTTHTLDAEAEAVITARAAIPAADLVEMRGKYAICGERFAPAVPDDVAVRDLAVPVPGGDEVAVRTYAPAGMTVTDGLLVWAHGGGWITGSAAGFDGTAAALATSSATRALSIDYSLAPENPFPRALEEVRAVLDWVGSAEGAQAIGHDPARVVVGGDSAGGNLVTVAARTCSVALAGQVLAYPVTDRRMERASYAGPSPVLSAEAMATCWKLYLGDAADHTPHPDFSPVDGELAGLPPTLLVLAGLDILHDDGLAYADALRAADVAVEVADHADLPHGFLEWSAAVSRSREAHERIGAFIRSHVS